MHSVPNPSAVEVRRSARRKRTVSAYRDGDRTVVLVPARMSRADERHWVDVMVERLSARERRSRPSDPELLERAIRLSERFLGSRARPASVRWVTNQGSRWGSCTVEDGSIRLSDRLQNAPGYVLDYVLLHELTHLLVPDHGPLFWAELASYPRTERARGFLEAWALRTPSTPAPAQTPTAVPAGPPALVPPLSSRRPDLPGRRAGRSSGPQGDTLFDQSDY